MWSPVCDTFREEQNIKRKYSISVTIEVEADVESLSEDNVAVYKDYMKKLIKHIHPMGAVVDYDGTCVEIVDTLK